MKISFTVVALFVSSLAFSQGIKVVRSRKNIGTVLATQVPIVGDVYTFPKYIRKFYFDTTRNVATVLIAKQPITGELINYSLSENKTLWNVPMDLSKEFYQMNEFLFWGEGFHTVALTNRSGDIRWTNDLKMVYFSTKKKISVGVKKRFLSSSIVVYGVDLRNGKEIWKREIKSSDEETYSHELNDSTVMIVANGISFINVKDGSGWDYYTDTQAKLTPNSLDKICGINSDVYSDSLSFYFASKEKIVSIDKKGNVLWSTNFPENIASKSFVFKRNNVVYVVNYGYIIDGFQRVSFGSPFLAAYDAVSGNKKYLNFTIGDVPVLDFGLNGDTLIIVQKKNIELVNLGKGELFQRRSFDLERSDCLLDYSPRRRFHNEGDTLLCEKYSEDEMCMVRTYKGEVFHISNSLDLIKKEQIKDLYSIVYKYKNYYITSSVNGSGYILGEKLRILATIKTGSYYEMKAGMLFFVDGNDLICLDLESLCSLLEK